VFPKEMIYEKKLSFGKKKKKKICENNDDMKNMILCMNACKAQRLGGIMRLTP
jgi:hypothetical protein